MIKNTLFAAVLSVASSLGLAQNLVIETTMGDMEVTLYTERSPKTVANFLQYVDSGFYNGVIFHRIIADFMIQTGGFDQNLTRKSTLPPVVNESNNYIKNKLGTLSMARTGDPNSATSQFFINHKYNRSLDYRFGKPGYAVFGEVTKGLQVLDAIARTPTAPKGAFPDMPVKPVIIKTIRYAEATAPAEEATSAQ